MSNNDVVAVGPFVQPVELYLHIQKHQNNKWEVFWPKGENPPAANEHLQVDLPGRGAEHPGFSTRLIQEIDTSDRKIGTGRWFRLDPQGFQPFLNSGSCSVSANGMKSSTSSTVFDLMAASANKSTVRLIFAIINNISRQLDGGSTFIGGLLFLRPDKVDANFNFSAHGQWAAADTCDDAGANVVTYFTPVDCIREEGSAAEKEFWKAWNAKP